MRGNRARPPPGGGRT